MTFAAADHSDDASEEEAPAERLLVRVLNPPVESIHSRKVEAGSRIYLVKLTGRSFGSCVWVPETELLDRDPALKNKLKRFDNTFDAAPWDPQSDTKTVGMDAESANVDRVMDSSDIFALIHPKKASDIRGKWGEGLIRVLKALTNFQSDQVYYGVFYIELGTIFKQYSEFAEAIDFAVISNRVYLDFYQTPDRFWEDLEVVYRNVDRLATYLDEKSDVHELNDRMKQLTARLYQDWLEKVRFEAEVFAAKMTQPHFAEDLERTRRDFATAHESGSATPGEFVHLFDSSRHLLRFPSHVGDHGFASALEAVEKLRAGLGMPAPVQAEANEKASDPQSRPAEVVSDEAPNSHGFNNDTANGEMEVEEVVEVVEAPSAQNAEGDDRSPTPTPNPTPAMLVEPPELPAPAPETNGSHEPTPPLSSQEIAALITQINDFVSEKTAFLDNVVNKVYWNDFLRQVHRLPALPRFLTGLTPITWTPEAQLATLGRTLETLYYVKWVGSSYLDSTWERESDLAGFDSRVKDFKRHTRAMDRESRKAYTNRHEAFTELRRLMDEPRLLERTPAHQISELKHRIFTYKDPKTVMQYTQKNQPIFKNERVLRSYQLESLNWMIEAWAKRRNVILADEMGLGKTIQAMAFLNHLISIEHQSGPYLVVAPLSTLSHWKRTFEDWTHLNTILYYDSKGKAGREMCQAFEFNHWDITMKGLVVKDNSIPRFSILITSFEVFTQDFETVFRHLPFQHVVIDEAHKLKNKNAKIITILKRLVCQRFLLLTGTPIQNNMSELWSLLNFIEPGTFCDLPRFLAEFQTGQDINSLQRLQEALNPFLLRRMKEDVESSIPPLTETIIDIELTSVQKIVYKTLYEKNKGTLQKGLGIAGISIMNNLEMQLRKCCNHPFTLPDIAENLTKDCHSNEAYFDKLVSTSGKMIFLDKALDKFGREGKKVLVFSQFTEVLRLIEEFLSFKGVRFFKIDGSTKAKERQNSIDKFNHNHAEFEVFLLSTKAGGVGINLTSASVVIIFDSDWNPQNDIQAIARAHRIGQTNEVKVFRLISKKTYESEMFERASIKLGLDQAIILANNYAQKGPDGATPDEFSRRKPEEIEMLLRKGAIGLIAENPEGSGEDGQFHQNIDDIIQNARTANYSVINKLYTFGKTKFVGDAKDELLQIDDPDFWKKAFANQKTTIDNFEKEYLSLTQSDKVKRLENQKGFFLRLSEEIYRYLNDRVTNEGFNADTEIRLSGLLIQISDNSQFHKVFRELAGQLNTDFNKSGRRIKKIDEKTLNALLKLAPTETGGRKTANGLNGSPTADEGAETGASARRKRGRDSDPRQGDARVSESDEDASVDSELYESDGEKILTALKKERKAKKEEKLRVCDFCGLKDNLVACSGVCRAQFHLICFQGYLAKAAPELAAAPPTEGAKSGDKEPSVFDKNGLCQLCQVGRAVCFACRDLGPLTPEVYLQANVGTSTDKSQVFRCSACPRFYHPGCMRLVPKSAPAAKESGAAEEKTPETPQTDFQCEQHFCSSCGVFSRSLYQCVECPFASHRKCMSKRNQILAAHKILCVKHIVKVEKPPKVDKKPAKEKPAPQEPKPAPEKKPKEAKEVRETPRAERKSDRKSLAVSEKPKDKPRDRTKEAPARPKATASPHKDEAQLGKRPKPASVDKRDRPTKAEKPSKKLKTSAESNQKLAFNLYQPFDYSAYRKVT